MVYSLLRLSKCGAFRRGCLQLANTWGHLLIWGEYCAIERENGKGIFGMGTCVAAMAHTSGVAKFEDLSDVGGSNSQRCWRDHHLDYHSRSIFVGLKFCLKCFNFIIWC